MSTDYPIYVGLYIHILSYLTLENTYKNITYSIYNRKLCPWCTYTYILSQLSYIYIIINTDKLICLCPNTFLSCNCLYILWVSKSNYSTFAWLRFWNSWTYPNLHSTIRSPPRILTSYIGMNRCGIPGVTWPWRHAEGEKEPWPWRHEGRTNRCNLLTSRGNDFIL